MFGILNINKRPGTTSRDEVNVVQRLIRPAKVGHAGTLDPMATGVLAVCVGPATKLIPYLQSGRKTYVAEFRFGQTSDTDDTEGAVTVNQSALPITVEQLEQCLPKYIGTIQQVPPQFSAVKVNGERAYSKARKGETLDLVARDVTIDRIDLLTFEWPTAVLKIQCGSGTYIRSLARDIGQELGCGGLMSALQRTAVGPLRVSQAVDVELLSTDNLEEYLISPLVAVSGMPEYRCLRDEEAALLTGKSLRVDQNRLLKPMTATAEPQSITVGTEKQVAVTDPSGNQLWALAEIQKRGQLLQPRSVFLRRGNP